MRARRATIFSGTSQQQADEKVVGGVRSGRDSETAKHEEHGKKDARHDAKHEAVDVQRLTVRPEVMRQREGQAGQRDCRPAGGLAPGAERLHRPGQQRQQDQAEQQLLVNARAEVGHQPPEKTRRLAEGELQAAIKLDARNASYRVMLAALYRDLGFYRRALSELERALSLDSQNADAREMLRTLELNKP